MTKLLAITTIEDDGINKNLECTRGLQRILLIRFPEKLELQGKKPVQHRGGRKEENAHDLEPGIYVIESRHNRRSLLIRARIEFV